MKILKLCYEFPPLGGGGAKVVDGLARELVKQGHEVDLVTMGFRGLPRSEVVDGIQVHRIPCIRLKKSICHLPEMVFYLLFAIPKLRKLIRQNKYDINHTHFIFPDGILAYIINKFTALPYIITAHGSDVPGYNPDRFKSLHKILAPFWKGVVTQAETIACPSESIEALIRSACKSAKTTLIPNGINVDKFLPHREKRDCILVVTRMFERKGVQYLLKALEGLDHHYEVHIVGDGPYLKTLQGFVDDKNLDVNFWGFLDNQSKEIRELYETSRIFILSSEAENFPLVLLEAMAAGMAIITTEGTGCAEVVGDAALLVKPRNSEDVKAALHRLIQDTDLCSKLGFAARERLETNFSWVSVSKRYSELYQKVLSQ